MAFNEPAPSGAASWNTLEWTQWLDATNAITSVRHSDALVCDRCFSAMAPRAGGGHYARCFNCNQRYRGLASAIVPISYSGSGALTSLIWQAKNDPTRAWLRTPLASLIYTFITVHRHCLERAAGGPFTYATFIPSHPSKRGGVDHLHELSKTVAGDWTGYPWAPRLLIKNKPSSADDRRGRVDADLFSTVPSLVGKRVLLLDDLYTSGSTTAAASATLQSAGAHPPVIVTVGRQVSQGPGVDDFITANTLEARRFELNACAVHG